MTEANCHESHSNSGSKTAYFISNSTMKMKNQTPLLTVPSRSSLGCAGSIIAALMAFCPTLIPGESITKPGGTVSLANGGRLVGSLLLDGSPRIEHSVNSSRIPGDHAFAVGTGFLLSMLYRRHPRPNLDDCPAFLGQGQSLGWSAFTP